MPDENWKGCPVAVSGATGFLGFHVCRLLIASGANVTALVRASSETSRLLAMGVQCSIAPLDEPRLLVDACRGREFLFHLAGAVDFNNDWQLCRKVNVQGTAHILKAANEAGVRRMIHASSIVAIGASKKPVRFDESSPWNLAGKNVPYVSTKREAEEHVLASRGKTEVVVVNPASIVGPDDFSESEFGVMCKRFWKGRIPLVFGGGNNFVDVRDVASGLLLAARLGTPGQRYILGGTNLSYTSFYSELARYSARSIPRFRIPTGLARIAAKIGDQFSRKQRKRPLLTSAQARLLGLFFYYDCAKSISKLGYQSRPLAETLRDAHAFWMGRSVAA
ncbi:MAG: NAD-dependent epimerase/dehydratase family protein [Gemmataceae bacterium]|nr:NAD-dependent epimerase/dehydratase family protein [Gemmataceae bacterium]